MGKVHEINDQHIWKYFKDIKEKSQQAWYCKPVTIIKRTVQIIFTIVAIAIFMLGIADIVFFHIK